MANFGSKNNYQNQENTKDGITIRKKRKTIV